VTSKELNSMMFYRGHPSLEQPIRPGTIRVSMKRVEEVECADYILDATMVAIDFFNVKSNSLQIDGAA
jgi:hypothetical protein